MIPTTDEDKQTGRIRPCWERRKNEENRFSKIQRIF